MIYDLFAKGGYLGLCIIWLCLPLFGKGRKGNFVDNLIALVQSFLPFVGIVVAAWVISAQISRLDARIEGVDARIDTMQTELHS